MTLDRYLLDNDKKSQLKNVLLHEKCKISYFKSSKVMQQHT